MLYCTRTKYCKLHGVLLSDNKQCSCPTDGVPRFGVKLCGWERASLKLMVMIGLSVGKELCPRFVLEETRMVRNSTYGQALIRFMVGSNRI